MRHMLAENTKGFGSIVYIYIYNILIFACMDLLLASNFDERAYLRLRANVCACASEPSQTHFDFIVVVGIL